ncbi:MAG: hypothetical protein R6U98_35140 [Pirellulaceae bacterium]
MKDQAALFRNVSSVVVELGVPLEIARPGRWRQGFFVMELDHENRCGEEDTEGE